MSEKAVISDRVSRLAKSAIHEMTRLSKEIEDVAFLSWAKPTAGTPEHIREAAISAIRNGLVGGYSENAGLPVLREEIVKKLDRDNSGYSAGKYPGVVGCGVGEQVVRGVERGPVRRPGLSC